ncbi:kynureninase [Niveibacterium sp. 24ML]|uniref:kynureninase n=1 Tax=Niveibacterium sp. 24ML TaxID=2985512 RepID=UPI0022716C48|nr:kynureninase [Niveibacterium sp. 24ML]MCX9157992.1 kynureninase [Niveibacterium sp. 24ML]
MISRDDCLKRDAADPLAPLREQFSLPAGVIYLDGNSLGPLPRATPERLAAVIRGEWGADLIKSWNSAGWIDLPADVGDQIAPLVGAGAGELIAADSTSVNLFKVLAAALRIVGEADPARCEIVSERDNFPTDLYIVQGLSELVGGRYTLRLVDSADEIPAALGPKTALLMLTQVNYRTGALHDMAALSAAAHTAGALTVWDLAHSAGALPVALNEDGADFAIGCGYKYLNGGPGAPAFVWVAPRHVDRFRQPLSGWMGHARPFDFVPGYEAGEGVARYLCGTPSILAMSALECGVETLLAAEPYGGMVALRAKSLALTELFIERVEARCAGKGLTLVTPREAARRGSQVSFAFDSAWPVCQALIARGVIGDFRAPDILRFGFAPLYIRFTDVWDAAEALAAVLETGEWLEARFAERSAVT